MNTNYLALYLVSLMWGSVFMFQEFSLLELEPLVVVSLRLSIGALVMFLLLGNWSHRLKLIGRQWVRCFGFGLIGVAIPSSLYAYGQLYVNSSTAAVTNAMMPMFTYIFAIAFVQDRISGLRIIGLCLGFFGVAILLNAQWQLSYQELLGTLICLGAPVGYALNAVLVRRYAGNLDNSALSFGVIAAAAVLVLIVTGTLEQPSLQGLSWLTWVSVICLGVFGTALPYKLFVYLVRKIGASRTSLTIYLVPVNAIPFGVLVLDEELSWNFYLGTLIILLSVALASGTKFSSLLPSKKSELKT